MQTHSHINLEIYIDIHIDNLYYNVIIVDKRGLFCPVHIPLFMDNFYMHLPLLNSEKYILAL